MFGKTIAARILGVSPKVLAKIVAPVDKAKNPHYRTGPEVLLYDPCDLLGAKEKRTYREAVTKRTISKSKDWPALMRARYGSPDAAIPDAAEALFNLNRYTRHATCSTLHRDEIFRLKSRFIRMLYVREEYTDRVEKLLRVLPEQECRHEGFELDCEKCGGTGVFREKQTVATYVFYFTIGDRKYCWMQRGDDLEFAPRVEESKPDDGHRGGDQTLNIPRKKLAEAKAIVDFAIGNEEMTNSGPEDDMTDAPPMPESAPATFSAEPEPAWYGGAAGGGTNDSANGSRDKTVPSHPPVHSASEDEAPKDVRSVDLEAIKQGIDRVRDSHSCDLTDNDDEPSDCSNCEAPEGGVYVVGHEPPFCQACLRESAEDDARKFAEQFCCITDSLERFDEAQRFAPTPSEYEAGMTEAYTTNSVRAYNRHNRTNYEEIIGLLDRYDPVDQAIYGAVRDRINELLDEAFYDVTDDEISEDEDEDESDG
ncbi:MAG TPA: hypothetical protein VK550_00615 [Polyangiaceae bacterium]|nr:hypothetical protein [Polyangiaceae bacterium]